MTLGSLFDGIGVFPLAATKHEIVPIWASEISKSAIAITKRHFPDMQHLGSITEIGGGKIPPVDIITFGSPCQDLSLMGNRDGLSGSKSNLFFEALRIIKEMRCATNGRSPTFAVWENVAGAFLSNDRLDFAAVLSAFIETKVSMPAGGRWANAGMVRGYTPDIAWRVLAANDFRIPQMRRRIFLVADYSGQRAAKILFEPQTLHENIQAGRKSRRQYSEIHRTSSVEAGREYREIYAIQARKMRGAAKEQDSAQFKGSFGRANSPIPTLLTDGEQAIFVHYPNNPIKDHLRFLAPVEYERLMGLPDCWTEFGFDGALISERARYFALGNSIAVPCAEFVIAGIAETLRGEKDG